MRYQHYFVFDIETLGEPFESFDEAQQEYLLRGAQTDEDKQKKIREFALSPMTARIVCIAFVLYEWNGQSEPVEKSKAVLLSDLTLSGDQDEREKLSDGAMLVRSSEARMLEHFWKAIQKYYDSAHLVTFNGQDFDAPFLMLRSAVCKVRPSRHLVDGKPWDLKIKHIDLQKELTLHQFGSQNSGATRRYNFDFYTRIFGIESPKSMGVHGGNVAEFAAEGRFREIAEYCMRDVRATWQLFRVWQEYLDFST